MGQHYSAFSGGLTLARDGSKTRKGKGEPVYDSVRLWPGQCHVRQSEIRKVKGTTRLDPKGCKIVGAGYTLHCSTVYRLLSYDQ